MPHLYKHLVILVTSGSRYQRRIFSGLSRDGEILVELSKAGLNKQQRLERSQQLLTYAQSIDFRSPIEAIVRAARDNKDEMELKRLETREDAEIYAWESRERMDRLLHKSGLERILNNPRKTNEERAAAQAAVEFFWETTSMPLSLLPSDRDPALAGHQRYVAELAT